MLTQAATYTDLYRDFRWAIPDRYNIGVDICDKHAPEKPALIHKRDGQETLTYTFGDLKRLSNKLANVLTAHGLTRGDRIGILLPQSPETAIAHIAAYKAGLIATPLFTLFGQDALEYRLGACGAAALVTDRASLPKIAAIRDRLPALKLILCVDGPETNVADYAAEMEKASDAFTPVDTAAEDPALIIFTSGTTGQPKGALHAHRVLLGHLPGVEYPHNFFPQPGDLYWTPADWAWIGGLIDVLLPSLHHGIPVLTYRAGKFDPEETFGIIADHGVRNIFLPPTALKLMRQVSDPAGRYDLDVRSVASGGESLGAELLDWGRGAFGLTINEFYGQTECNLVLGNCADFDPIRPGATGKPIPGHTVAIIDDDGNELPAGEVGHIAVKRPDPVMFLEYWNNPEATREKFIGDWLITGDTGTCDEDGYIWYGGRSDDVITSAGYRIGPGEVEDCLLKHDAVAMAAVVGVPDPVRTEAVKAFIVLREGAEASETLAAEIQAFVKNQLAAHEYPRLVEFIDELPMTTTGKIMRRELRARG